MFLPALFGEDEINDTCRGLTTLQVAACGLTLPDSTPTATIYLRISDMGTGILPCCTGAKPFTVTIT